MGKEIGIDFGTTNTVVSYINKKGKLRQLRYKGADLIPSVVYFHKKNDFIIGIAAKRAMETESFMAGVANFKPKIGDKEYKYEITAENGDKFTMKPRKVAALFLGEVIKGVEEKLLKDFGPIEGCIDRVVLTVPAKFSSTDKEAVRRAAKEAGFKVPKLAAEPTAAAIAYEKDLGEQENDDKAILVYDFGGGTFDLSVIQRQHDVFKEIATSGDKNLGGNTLTMRLEELLLERINDEYAMDMPLDEEDFDEEINEIGATEYRQNMQAIHQAANIIKEELSDDEDVTEVINIYSQEGKNEPYNANVSRRELEQCIRKDIKKSVDITKRTIKEAEDQNISIGQIVLAGGSSNIPLVKEMMDKELGRDDIVYSDDVSTVISRGAAIMAQDITNMDSMAQQITNVQLGVAATEGMQYKKFQMIIPENAPLPCSRSRSFKLANDGQRRLEIAYYEYDVKNYPNAVRVDEDGINEIDRLIIDNLPAGLEANDTNIIVEFTAQKDGSLDISVDIEDSAGKKLTGGNLSVMKESDLE